MGGKYQAYRDLDYPLPSKNFAWNLYGAGMDKLGRDGKPEAFTIPQPNDDQLLVRVDSIGICFSDIKIIKQGGNHPKLYNRDLAVNPTRLGHEASITIVSVGENLKGKYHRGQRISVQPDIYQNGKSTAYGYTIPGGLIQYHLIGEEVLVTDEGACLLPVEDEMGYAESSLLEPWGCVMAAYTQRRRLYPKAGGLMWIIGTPGDTNSYSFSSGLEAPSRIVLTNVPASLIQIIKDQNTNIIEQNGLSVEEYGSLSKELTNGTGFDDIVVLGETSAEKVSQIARFVARRGTCNLVGNRPLDGLATIDFGRLHSDYIAFLGTSGNEISESYGDGRNRCELRPNGTAVFIGAGGPMGQMHVQRALELPAGPKTVIATEVSDDRLQTLREMFVPLAQKNGRTILFFNPMTSPVSFHEFVMEKTGSSGADDVVICVPHAGLMEEGMTALRSDGMAVFFAGVPVGTMGHVDLSQVYLSNAQYTGTSGLTMDDQSLVMKGRLNGTLSPGRSVAAIGGMDTAVEAFDAVAKGKYPGKVVVFPQIRNLPLIALKDLKEYHPDIAEKLGDNYLWTNEAEELLIEKLWEKPE